MPATDFSKDFGPFEGKTWLNTAHQGALPRVAAAEAREAIEWKVNPHLLTTDRFSDVPLRVKRALARLIHASPDDIILGNSASYGLHLLANGFPWQKGDEVLLVQGDFPSVILPWLDLERRGVCVRCVEPRGAVIDAKEVAGYITPATRIFCTTWVHSFTGHVVDVDALGEVCRASGVKFMLNTSQALGTRPLDVAKAPVDAITNVGFKWLCGPYGTGFCWMRPELRESLQYNQNYWLAMQTADELGTSGGELGLRDDLGARKYDVFGTANFFNFKPWATSLEYVLEQGVDCIAAHNDHLVSGLVDGLDRDKYHILSPAKGPDRSTLVLISHQDRARNEGVYHALRREEIYAAYRRDNIRLAPHLYNTDRDIDRALTVLNEA
jgi:selenocysteine lyase/cysteine desulfurase